jgi:hypothetical protein
MDKKGQNMVDKPQFLPPTRSIQTGGQRVQNLIILREDKQEDHQVAMPQEECPVDALQPPPFIPEEEPVYQGNFGELSQPVMSQESGGTKFDPSSNMNSMRQKQPYHIIDLFWFINPRINDMSSLPVEEAHFCQMSYNIDFGNIKATLFKIPNGALYGHVLFLMSLQRLTSGTIYPSSLFKLQYESKRLERGDQPIEFTCLEQLIYRTDESWQFNRPVCTFKINNSIMLTITDKNSGKFYYNFTGWQKDALLHSANFATNQGYLLTGQQNINGFKE